MGCPCWMATTRRVVKERPSRMRSTVYTMGAPGSPEQQEVHVRMRVPVLGDRAPAATRACAATCRRRPRDDGRGMAAEDVLLDPLQVSRMRRGLKCLTHAVAVVSCGCFPVIFRGPSRPMSFAMIDFMISLVPP